MNERKFKMNRRSFFQSILAGIGALVGHKAGYGLPSIPLEDMPPMPPVKPPKIDKEHGDQFEEWAKNIRDDALSYTITVRGISCDGETVMIDYEVNIGIDVKKLKFSTDAKTNETTD